MSVIIQGFEMPTSCAECEFVASSNLHNTACCTLTQWSDPCFSDNSLEYREKRADFCPLIELAPHGDLIDRDAFLYEHQDDYVDTDYIRDAPVIIPREETNE